MFHTAIVLFVDVSVLPLGNFSFMLISFMMHSVLHPLIEGCFIPEIKMTFKTALCISYLQKHRRKQRRRHSIATSEMGIVEDEQLQGCRKQCLESLNFAVIQERMVGLSKTMDW